MPCTSVRRKSRPGWRFALPSRFASLRATVRPRPPSPAAERLSIWRRDMNGATPEETIFDWLAEFFIPTSIVVPASRIQRECDLPFRLIQALASRSGQTTSATTVLLFVSLSCRNAPSTRGDSADTDVPQRVIASITRTVIVRLVRFQRMVEIMVWAELADRWDSVLAGSDLAAHAALKRLNHWLGANERRDVV